MRSLVLVPDRRTMIVLGSLLVGMTLTSGLLLLLEPGPVAPFSGITLQAIDRMESEPRTSLLDTAGEHDWQAIVIHDSGTLRGSSASLDAAHRQMGHGSLGYHFVINNGNGREDGLIEVASRWSDQQPGSYLNASDHNAAWFHEHAIGVCLIGDVDQQHLTDAQLHQLIWLVQELQRKYNIPRDRVFVDVGSRNSSTAMFPQGWFRQQLLSSSGS